MQAKTKTEAERVGKSMIRPLLSLERLSFDETEGQVCYQYGKEPEEVERMDYLEFVARVTSHIPVISRDLYSLRMAEGVNCHKDARSAGIAKNENLIFKSEEGEMGRRESNRMAMLEPLPNGVS